MDTEVVVIGAGQAGLAAAYGLRRTGLEPGPGFAVLDADNGPGGAWRHRWPTLRVDTTHRIHDLPGLAFTPGDPTRPAAEVVPAYFAAYERAFDLRVRRPVRVTAVRDAAARSPGAPDGTSVPRARAEVPSGAAPGRELLVETDQGTWTARFVINATGTWTHPFVPRLAGQETFRGRQLHAATYGGPEPFAGLRVAVVGGGTTAVQLLMEIAPVTAATTWVTRRPPLWHDGPFDEEAGRAAVTLVEERVRAGLPPRSVVGVTGLLRTPAVVAAQASGVLDRHPMPARLTADGLEWADGSREAVDVVLWATGWRPALDHLAPLHLRGAGGGIAMDGTRVAADPRLHLVGYGPSASTIGANRAGQAAARAVGRQLRTRVSA